MTIEITVGKSCETQLFPTGKPTAKWSLDQLVAYVQEKHAAIAEAEQPLSAHYWQLGQALTLVRAKFKHGKWGQYLESLGIDKTRASKAIAIFQANSSEKDAAKLTVAGAYAKRQRKKKLPKSEPARLTEKGEFRQFLQTVRIEAEKYVNVAGFLEPAEAVEFQLDVEKSVEALTNILKQLQRNDPRIPDAK